MHYGNATGQQIDDILLRMARAAADKIIRNTSTEVFLKTAYDGTPDGDLATQADRDAQAACEAIRLAEMPWAGVIAEEDGLVVEGKMINGFRSYFTIDGLDGTRRYNSGARDGIATMIAFVHGDETVAAVVYDVFSSTAYILSAANGGVLRIDRSGNEVDLRDRPRTKLLPEGPYLARGRLRLYPHMVFKLLAMGPEFTWVNHLSIGASMARLWDDRVLLHVQSPGSYTPWDDTPVVAIGRALGMVWLRPSKDEKGLEVYTPEPVTQVSPRPHMIIMVHQSRLDALAERVAVRR